jgi:hypothetical protein
MVMSDDKIEDKPNFSDTPEGKLYKELTEDLLAYMKKVIRYRNEVEGAQLITGKIRGLNKDWNSKIEDGTIPYGKRDGFKALLKKTLLEGEKIPAYLATCLKYL